MERGSRDTLITAAAYVARAAVGIALIGAGTIKAAHPADFIRDIWTYRLVPEDYAYWIAAFLPWLEIATGAALVANRQRAGASLLAAGMLAAFLAAILISWIRGLDIACGCFGGPPAGGATNYAWLVSRDLLLLGCLAFGVLADRWQRRRTVIRD